MTIESIVNQALDRIGYKRHIGTMWEGSVASRVALDCWGETRDTLFSIVKPEWATWDDELIPSKAAPPWYDDVNPWTPDYPDLPWRYEYPLPDLCLVPLALHPRPAYLPVWRPRPMRFRRKAAVLLGDDPAPVLTSVHSVHDPAVWDNPFIEAVVETLARSLARSLAPGAVQDQKQEGQHADNAR